MLSTSPFRRSTGSPKLKAEDKLTTATATETATPTATDNHPPTVICASPRPPLASYFFSDFSMGVSSALPQSAQLG